VGTGLPGAAGPDQLAPLDRKGRQAPRAQRWLAILAAWSGAATPHWNGDVIKINGGYYQIPAARSLPRRPPGNVLWLGFTLKTGSVIGRDKPHRFGIAHKLARNKKQAEQHGSDTQKVSKNRHYYLVTTPFRNVRGEG
jgi:alkanesulfonate monooxygenase SsuD/methylene tetrahydromethanopterin reductase-like flavin-dependent oxidoreductase (luciferase family)